MTRVSLALLVFSLPIACGPARPASEAPPVVQVPSASASAWRPVRAQPQPQSERDPVDSCSPDGMSKEAAREQFKQGVQAYSAGDLRAALGFFERAYTQTCTPQVLYNVAVTRENLGEVEGAIRAFELFLTMAPETPRLREVQERIQALRARR